MITHMLVPYDKSESANRAFEYAIDLAKKYNSSISIVTCVPIHATADPYFGASDTDTTKLLDEDSLDAISKLESRLKELNIPCKTEILNSLSITESLLGYAKTYQVDMIVMGSRGLSGFKKLLLGSVASGILQYSKCPVLIVK